MNTIFSKSNYVIKRQGLSIAGKYRIFPQEGNDPLFFVELKTKWIPPSTMVHVYTDEKKTHEVLTLKDRPTGAAEDMDVNDAENGQKIGALVMGAETVSEIFKDAWSILDAEDKPIGKVFEKNLGKSLVRNLVSHDLPQQMDINIGEITVGELRQKVKPISYELQVDFSQDVSSLLDHRMGIAAGILTAIHQGNEVD
jgi:hypothetical protein